MEPPRTPARPILKKRSPQPTTPKPPAFPERIPRAARMVPVAGLQKRESLLLIEGTTASGDRQVRIEVERITEKEPVVVIQFTDLTSDTPVAFLRVPLASIRTRLQSLLL